MDLVIFANVGLTVGLGHIYRCLPLAKFFKQCQWHVRLFAPEVVQNTLIQWDQSLFKELSPIINQNSVVILDAYDHTEDWKKLIQQRPDLTLVRFDDRKESIEGEDLVINAAPDVDSTIYQSKSLCGPGYSVIDDSFLSRRKTVINDNIRSILIALGGADVNNQMTNLLKQVSSVFTGTIFVVGENIPSIMSHNISSLGMVTQHQLAEYMKQVDLGIFAGGTMIYQALCVGLPIMVFPQTKYQSQHVRLWAESKAVIPIYKLNQFEGAWNYLSLRPNREKLSFLGKEIVDGLGAKRVMEAIIEIH